MLVTVIGAGHVGLVVAPCLADFGLEVLCVDSDAARITRLQKGELPFYEPGLPDIVEKNVRAGRLTFSNDVDGAIRRAAVAFIAVGTEGPDGLISLDAVYAVAERIAAVAGEY